MPIFVSLADVKINNEYDYIETVAPTVAEKEPDYVVGEQWLNLTDGLSYELIDQVAGTWEQIEKDKDAKINTVTSDNSTFKTVTKEVSNPWVVDRNERYTDLDLEDYFPPFFTNKENFFLYNKECVFSKWTFDAGTKTITVGDDIYGTLDNFVAGDVILVSGSRRNDDYYTIDTVTSTTITVVEDIVDGEANAFICLTIIPQNFINILGRMIQYDVYTRNSIASFESERIGTYTYTLGTFNNGLRYPDQVIAGLESIDSVSIGGLNVFVN